jgi:SAM-dependent methyltransferase
MTYNLGFFEKQGGPSLESARALVPKIIEWLEPASLIDVGCGTGAWAAVALSEGVPDVLGVDGDYVDQRQLVIPPDRFAVRNLAEPFRMDRRFDLALCLEVAEHLPPSRGPGFIDDLCAVSDVIVFSAAIPGQQGTHHVNLRWQSYWANLFIERGRSIVDDLRASIWRDARVGWWYRQNVLVATAVALPRLEHPPVSNIVHPESTFRDVGLRTLLSEIPAAARTATSRRLKGR